METKNQTAGVPVSSYRETQQQDGAGNQAFIWEETANSVSTRCSKTVNASLANRESVCQDPAVASHLRTAKASTGASPRKRLLPLLKRPWQTAKAFARIPQQQHLT
jgi:hypothetical protein